MPNNLRQELTGTQDRGKQGNSKVLGVAVIVSTAASIGNTIVGQHH